MKQINAILMKSLPLCLVLHNWADYDLLKFKQHKDPRMFNPDEYWEVVYLVNKIRMIYPAASEQAIADAIGIIGSTGPEGRQRRVFVHRVLAQVLHNQMTPLKTSLYQNSN